jgi:2-dehydro-3-deoxyphosphogluconate aldolase/(4S)-4-hydroxy-2-oxoglutarate aldolase
MDVESFRKLPVLGILRGITPEDLEPLLMASESAGLRTIEITMNTPDAARLIRRAVAFCQVSLAKNPETTRAANSGPGSRDLSIPGQRLTVGAGTVLTMKDLKSALDAGAGFIVMPVLVKNVMAYCVKHRIPAFPGALTPQEIQAAWRSGATMVKVFPSNFFGPRYFREIKGPFSDIELLACGGVTPKNLGAYFACGATAVSFGASVFRKEWLARKEFAKIKRAIREYLRALEGLRSLLK